MDTRPIYGVLSLAVLYAAYGLWKGASPTVTLAATFLLLAGVGLTGYGLFGVLDPQTVARFSEQLDAIGSKTDLSTVEPRGWKVSLTKFQSVFLVLIGIFNVGAAALFLVWIS